MKYVVKGNCVIFWLCIIKGESLWWNMLNMAAPFEQCMIFLEKALGDKAVASFLTFPMLM